MLDNMDFRLTVNILLPIFVTVGFYLLENKTPFKKMPRMFKQVIIGIVYGGVAIFATEHSVEVGGAAINIRDAAPLAAGMIFGAPAGIIAGIIGAVERWFAVLWGIGTYTRVACTVATFSAGLFGAFIRKVMFDDKKPTVFYGIFVGITTEVYHMLLIFITNISDSAKAYSFVKACSVPMIVGNSLSLGLCMIAVSLISGEYKKRSRKNKKIAQSFQTRLLLAVVIAFALTTLFTNGLHTNTALKNTNSELTLNCNDISESIKNASDKNLLGLTRKAAGVIVDDGRVYDADTAYCQEIADLYNVSVVSIIGPDNIIKASNYEEYIGFDMTSGDQANEFAVKMATRDYFVQDYMPITKDSTQYFKYAATRLGDGYYVQVGYNSTYFQDDIATYVEDAARYRHIGTSGFVVILDGKGNIVSDSSGHTGLTLDTLTEGNDDGEIVYNEMERFTAPIFNEDCFCMFKVAEGYAIVSILPVAEAMFSRDVAVILTLFIEVIIFSALFFVVYYLIKKRIVENINKINGSLGEITKGNLDVQVNVRSNTEFASLSDDINYTVDTLKGYIKDAADRINQELEFAKSIQHSVLPSVFPPYPDHKEFDIYASMNTAKEVGGDFYDFYLLGEEKLAFLVADVSGKGIPAAMFMMTSKTLLKSLTETGENIEDVFEQANNKLCENNEAGMFVTAWMGILDLTNGNLDFISAGHNPPLIKHENGNFEYVKCKSNFILAGMDGIKYKKQQTVLEPGDVIFLYTDGVTEAQNVNEELYGEARLERCLDLAGDKKPDEICADVLKDVMDHTGEASQFDDITMLSVRLNYLIADADTVKVNAVSSSVPLVAQYIEKKLADGNVSDKIANKIRIAVDEIYSNIVKYSGAKEADIKCSITEDSADISFVDDGAEYNPLKAKEPDTTQSAEERGIGGLGLFIVKKLMDKTEYNYSEGKNRLNLSINLKSDKKE